MWTRLNALPVVRASVALPAQRLWGGRVAGLHMRAVTLSTGKVASKGADAFFDPREYYKAEDEAADKKKRQEAAEYVAKVKREVDVLEKDAETKRRAAQATLEEIARSPTGGDLKKLLQSLNEAQRKEVEEGLVEAGLADTKREDLREHFLSFPYPKDAGRTRAVDPKRGLYLPEADAEIPTRRKVPKSQCPLSVHDAPVIDYKNTALLSSFIYESGRIVPRRLTGVSSKMQRRLAKAIKQARVAGLMPYMARAPEHARIPIYQPPALMRRRPRARPGSIQAKRQEEEQLEEELVDGKKKKTDEADVDKEAGRRKYREKKRKKEQQRK